MDDRAPDVRVRRRERVAKALGSAASSSPKGYSICRPAAGKGQTAGSDPDWQRKRWFRWCLLGGDRPLVGQRRGFIGRSLPPSMLVQMRYRVRLVGLARCTVLVAWTNVCEACTRHAGVGCSLVVVRMYCCTYDCNVCVRKSCVVVLEGTLNTAALRKAVRDGYERLVKFFLRVTYSSREPECLVGGGRRPPFQAVGLFCFGQRASAPLDVCPHPLIMWHVCAD